MKINLLVHPTKLLKPPAAPKLHPTIILNRLRPTGIRLLVGLAALTGLLVSQNLRADVIVSDGTFSNADWDVTVFTGGNGGTASGFMMDSGGNPDSYRRVTHNIAAALPKMASSVTSFHRRQGATYDPSVQGPIGSVDYSEDSIIFMESGGGSGGQGAGPGLRQGGVVYTANSGFAATETNWTHNIVAGLGQNDFAPIDPAATNAHPNFSATGGVIEFGFIRSNSSFPGANPFMTDGGIDNWQFLIRSAQSAPPEVTLIRAVRPSFSSLSVGTNYQLQVSSDLNIWTNQGTVFMATNTAMAYPQYFDVDNWNSLFLRLQVAP